MIIHSVSIQHDVIRCSETNQTIRDNRDSGLKFYFLQLILIVEAKNFMRIYSENI